MFFILSSKDSLDMHPKNFAWDFTVDLKKIIPLSGNWECALVDLKYTGNYGDLYVFSDICEPNYVSERYLPILRVTDQGSNSFSYPYYMKISRDHIDRIRIYIRGGDGKIPSKNPDHLRCTLHLRNVSY